MSLENKAIELLDKQFTIDLTDSITGIKLTHARPSLLFAMFMDLLRMANERDGEMPIKIDIHIPKDIEKNEPPEN